MQAGKEESARFFLLTTSTPFQKNSGAPEGWDQSLNIVRLCNLKKAKPPDLPPFFICFLLGSLD